MKSLNQSVVPQNDRLVKDTVAAEYLGVSPGTLRRARLLGTPGPPWIRVTDSAIRYSMRSLEAYVASRPTGGSK